MLRPFGHEQLPQQTAALHRELDVVGGAAGAILGLLALYNATSERTVLERAIACGHHLLEQQVSLNDAPRAWQTVKKIPLVGFAHGAAGIAYALLRLYAVTGERAYFEGAEEGIAYEQHVFCPTDANWPDFRFEQEHIRPSFATSWCHGAPGIALARLGSLSVVNSLKADVLQHEVDIALQTTQNIGLQDVDQICCGNLGLVDVLLVGAQQLLRPELYAAARHRAAQVVARAQHEKNYHLLVNVPHHTYSPGFFQGTAGIGYMLLRLAEPDALPSVLLWKSGEGKESPLPGRVR